MKRWMTAVLAAGLLGGCATSVVRPVPVEVAEVEEAACTPDAAGKFGDFLNFRRGRLPERECALRIIALAGADRDGEDQFAEVRRGVGLLHGFYNRRAERQQTFMDVGAGLTLFSSAAAFEGGLSNSTRQAWGVAAFAPVVLTQFNGNEPTRELFHGGALALQLITTRYDRLDRALEAVEAAETDTDCAGINALVGRLDEAMRAGRPLRREDPEGLLVAEARELQGECLKLGGNHALMSDAVRYATTVRSLLAADYADGVLQLDHALLAKDRDLRYTPAETLSAIVASPLRAADSLLTGENAQQALDILRTQVAFTGLNRSLGAVRLPPLPRALPEVGTITAGVDALDRTGSAARRAVFAPYMHDLRTHAAGLRRTQLQQDFALTLSAEYAAAAASDHLTFAYDPTTSTTTITLAPRPVTPDPLATATTAAGSAPPMTP